MQPVLVPCPKVGHGLLCAAGVESFAYLNLLVLWD